MIPETPKIRATANGFDWTADNRGQGLSLEDARAVTTEKIESAISGTENVLFEAIPPLGKSYGTIAAAAATGTPITVLTGRGHKEQYQQIREWCDEYGLSSYTFPSFLRDCATARGEHGERQAEIVRRWYRRGATPKEIHMYAEYELGKPLGCQCHEGGECLYTSKWRFDPNDYDVLIGHYAHAYQPTVTQGRTIVIDEFPDGAYETELGPTTLPRAVTMFLQTVDAIPFDDYADLMDGRSDEQRRADALAWFGDENLERDGSQAFRDGGHAQAPLAVFTLLVGATNDLGNGWEHVEIGEGRVGLFNREQGKIHLLTPPNFTYAHSVVALDGTPIQAMWKRILGIKLNHQRALSRSERETYIRDALNLNLVRMTEYIKPYNSANHISVDRDAALLEEIAEEHGNRPAVITTSTAEEVYDTADVLEHAKATKHYGNVLGSNEFADERLGAVIGSQHYGDQFIEKWGAYEGEAITRNNEKGNGLEYGPFGDKILTHMCEHETLQVAIGSLAGVAELLFDPLAAVSWVVLELVANAHREADLRHADLQLLEADGVAALNLLAGALDIVGGFGREAGRDGRPPADGVRAGRLALDEALPFHLLETIADGLSRDAESLRDLWGGQERFPLSSKSLRRS